MKPTINYNNLNPMQKGRLKKVLSEKYNFSKGIFTLEEYILQFGTEKYLANVQTRNGVNKGVPSLRTGETSIDIPKIVYDNLEFKA